MTGQPSVLLVDDDPLIGMLVGALLEAAGWSVAVATTVAEARALLAAGQPPRALVLDEQLSDGSGLQLVGAAGSGTHVVLHSGAEHPCLPPGVDAVVSKLGPPGALVDHLAGI